MLTGLISSNEHHMTANIQHLHPDGLTWTPLRLSQITFPTGTRSIPHEVSSHLLSTFMRYLPHPALSVQQDGFWLSNTNSRIQQMLWIKPIMMTARSFSHQLVIPGWNLHCYQKLGLLKYNILKMFSKKNAHNTIYLIASGSRVSKNMVKHHRTLTLHIIRTKADWGSQSFTTLSCLVKICRMKCKYWKCSVFIYQAMPL